MIRLPDWLPLVLQYAIVIVCRTLALVCAVLAVALLAGWH